MHLINLDPSQIKAQDSSIVEYNRLRMLYRPDLSINRKRVKKNPDIEWAIRSNISNVQEHIDNNTKKTNIPRKRRKNSSRYYE